MIARLAPRSSFSARTVFRGEVDQMHVSTKNSLRKLWPYDDVSRPN